MEQVELSMDLMKTRHKTPDTRKPILPVCVRGGIPKVYFCKSMD